MKSHLERFYLNLYEQFVAISHQNIFNDLITKFFFWIMLKILSQYCHHQVAKNEMRTFKFIIIIMPTKIEYASCI